MFGIGFQELLLIFIIALIFFGPSKLPQVARAIGEGIREFKKAMSDEPSRTTVEERVDSNDTSSEDTKTESPETSNQKMLGEPVQDENQPLQSKSEETERAG